MLRVSIRAFQDGQNICLDVGDDSKCDVCLCRERHLADPFLVRHPPSDASVRLPDTLEATETIGNMRDSCRRHVLRIVIGAVLVALLYGVLTVVLPYQRELRIERKLESFDIEAIWVYCGPHFLPKWVQENSRVFDRIEFLSSSGEKIFSREESSEFVNVSNLRGFNGMLAFDFTDADLEPFKVLTRLESLHLENTQTTPEGRDRLRKALPNCEITPDP
jgi:hypothetical protein